MRALSKPLSSPGRAEKFPPPLMRFLRSNVGSRSRGRSRSSPLFYIRSKRTAAGEIVAATQEPSSPKVTCIGQVRVRRSSKSKDPKASGAAPKRRVCWWLKKALSCGKISWRFRRRKRLFRRVFCKWAWFFKCGCCKKVDGTDDDDSFRVYSDQKSEQIGNLAADDRNYSTDDDSESDYNGNKYENLGAGNQERKMDFLDSCSSSSPPKNALLLTRCRSAPYRSSSLGSRFWGSPLSAEKASENGTKEKSEELLMPICENGAEGPIYRQENSKELEGNVQELKGTAGATLHPLLLMRCKSEPSRTGEMLVPEASFFRHRRSGGADHSSQESKHDSK